MRGGSFRVKRATCRLRHRSTRTARGGIGIEKKEGFDWNAHEALRQVPAEQRYGSLDPATFCGLDYTKWGAQIVSGGSVDRRRWYTFLGRKRAPGDVVADVLSEGEMAEVGVFYQEDGVEDDLLAEGLLEDEIDGDVSDDFMSDEDAAGDGVDGVRE